MRSGAPSRLAGYARAKYLVSLPRLATTSGETPRDFPLFFRYLNFVHEVGEHELQTDIYLPLR